MRCQELITPGGDGTRADHDPRDRRGMPCDLVNRDSSLPAAIGWRRSLRSTASRGVQVRGQIGSRRTGTLPRDCSRRALYPDHRLSDTFCREHVFPRLERPKERLSTHRTRSLSRSASDGGVGAPPPTDRTRVHAPRPAVEDRLMPAPAKKQAIRCVQGAFGRGAPGAVDERSRSERSNRLGWTSFPQAVPSLWRGRSCLWDHLSEPAPTRAGDRWLGRWRRFVRDSGR